MTFDLDAYLARVRLPARVTPDAEGLDRLQLAQRLAIPFENLDIALGRDVAIDSAAVFAKLVTARRGGYCFEQNRLFRDALAALGFDSRPLLARVWLRHQPGDPVPPLTHTLALVTLDGEEWVADAGFGGGYAPVMPLRDSAEAVAPDGALHRLERDGADGWMMRREGQPQFGFTLATVEVADLAMANHWTSTAPATRFTTLKLVSIALPRGYATLTDTDYRRRVGDEEAEAVIIDPRVYRLRLSMMFGIDLSAEEVARLGLF